MADDITKITVTQPDAETGNGEAAPTGPETGDKEIDWQAQAEDYRNLYLRTQADMDNMRKRLEREKAEFVKFANENVMKELLSVMDNLERALAHATANGEAGSGLAQGVKLTYDGFKSVLDKFGVSQVQAVGERFDPNFHEAVMQREDPDADENTVIEEIQKGYLLNERLIRPSMVVVAKRPAGDGEDL
ncbi:MAG: nucleotide exchange factor GrpE [Proteobacteria bacterium]|nr:nucleotide exchange factor GrpE [Pseudomonadota bacterium]